jgi:hypothetical protein
MSLLMEITELGFGLCLILHYLPVLDSMIHFVLHLAQWIVSFWVNDFFDNDDAAKDLEFAPAFLCFIQFAAAAAHSYLHGVHVA